MRKLSLILLFLIVELTAWAITQPGYVRTIARPNYNSERLDGVLIRVRGNHNPIVSTETGDFSILMQDLRVGDPYALSAVMKSGYQLVEQDFIGRNQVGSDKVPLVVSMVSTTQLQAEKTAIANKARAEVEKRYMEQMALLKQQLDAKKLVADEYERRMSELDDQYMRLQTQVDDMAEKYARTDYDALDSISAQINLAIEQGDLDLAERLIQEKGSFAQREERMHNLQRAAAAELADIQRDCYHMYSISLSRFQPDSADYYLRRRADVDTTNAAAQLDYAQFLNGYRRNRDLAFQYIQRAERHVRHTDGVRSSLMLRVLNEKGNYLYHSAFLDDAVVTYTDAVALSKEINGDNSQLTAGRIASLGASYYALKQYKEAMKQLNEAMRIYHIPGEEHPISEATVLNTMGAIAMAQNDNASARGYLERAVAIIETVAPNDNSLPVILANIAIACKRLDEEQLAADYYQRAYDAAVRIFGEQNNFTKFILSKMQL